jgi:hypothetical protein
MAATTTRARYAQSRKLPTMGGVALALIVCATFWLAVGGLAWLVLR